MSKKMVYIREDRTIAVGNPSSTAISALTGSGGLVREANIEWEIAKHFIANDADAASCKANHVSFLAPHIGSAREVAVRAWVVGITRGGMTEGEALAALDAFSRPADCTSCEVVEDTDLPTDRYFRDAWEWSS